MFRRAILPVFILGAALPLSAQLSQDARYAILGGMVATEGAARIPMPLGKTGVELSDSGVVDRDKLQKELTSNGQIITAGKVVRITAIDFHDKSIEFEIDGGGTKKKNFLSNIQGGVGVGGVTPQQQDPRKQTPEAKGSKVTLLFDKKIPPELTVDELKMMLNPVMDFAKQSLLRTGIDALPPEFQEAVKAKEARVGMDSNTVLLALGQPNRRHREKTAEGVEQEDWIYNGRGKRQTFVTFENDVVVNIRQYE